MGFVGSALLLFGANVGGGGVLAFGEPVDTVVFDDVDHVHVATDGVDELADTDGRRVAVTGHTKVQQVLVDGVGTGGDRGHAAVNSVETVGLAEVVCRGLGGTSNPRHLGDAMGLKAVLPGCCDDDV